MDASGANLIKCQQILTRLTENKLPRDDTFLTKFKSVLCDIVTVNDNALLCNLETFVKRFNIEKDEVDPEVVDVFISLSAHILKKNPESLELPESDAMQFICCIPRIDYVWKNSRIKATWLECFKDIIQSTEGLCIFYRKGFHSTTKESMSHESLYVRRNATSLLAQFINSTLDNHGSEPEGRDAMMCILSEVFDALNSPRTQYENGNLTKRETMKSLSFEQAVDLLLEICGDQKRVSQLLEVSNFPKALIQFTRTNTTSLQQIQNVSETLNLCHRCFQEEHWKDIYLQLEMFSNVDMSALQLVFFLLKCRSYSDKRNLREIHAIFWSPLMAVVGKPLPSEMMANLGDVHLKLPQKRAQVLQLVNLILSSMQDDKSDQYPDMEMYQSYLINLIEVLCDQRDNNTCLGEQSLLPPLNSAAHHRLLHSAIDGVIAVVDRNRLKSPAESMTKEIMQLFVCVIRLIKDIDIPLKIADSAFLCCQKCLEWLFVHQTENSLQMSDTLASMGDAVCRCLCHRSWEIRDSSLIFVSMLTKMAKGMPRLVEWLIEQKLPMLYCQALYDDESLVRASVLGRMTHIAEIPQLWKSVTTCTPTAQFQENLLDKIMEIVSKDDEAFARRAAVCAITAVTLEGHFASNIEHVDTLMNEAINDRDWQVKVNVLEYWKTRYLNVILVCLEQFKAHQIRLKDGNVTEDVMVRNDPEIMSSAIDECLKSCCMPVYLTALLDCDRATQKVACDILLDLLNKLEYYTAHFNQEPSSKISSCANEWHDGDEVSRVHINKVRSMFQNHKVNFCNFVTVLSLIPFASLKTDLSQSIDCHDENTENFLDDLLFAISTPESKSERPEDEPEVVIDCY